MKDSADVPECRKLPAQIPSVAYFDGRRKSRATAAIVFIVLILLLAEVDAKNGGEVTIPSRSRWR
jgi:hypothetical protein